MKKLVSALLLLALGACLDDGRRESRTAAIACTSKDVDVSRCSGTNIVVCDGAGTWVVREACGDAQRVCRVGDGTIACVDAEDCAIAGTCADGAPCATPAACRSGVCGTAGICLASTCGNGRQDGTETAVDCGGPCPLCFGAACSTPAQCVTNDCRGGVCSEPSCTDGVRNGAETSADCGGECPPCPIGAACRVPTDCATGVCEGEQCAAPPPSCTDGAKSGDETDVDCGGPCPACGLDRSCSTDTDCVSMFCDLGTCRRATCEDGIRNQNEAGVDCGGPCPACTSGSPCSVPGDCETGRCEAGFCASCADGMASGDEADVDCGGPCARCRDGNRCRTAADCLGGACESGMCCTLNSCGVCAPEPQELCNGVDDDCDNQIDEGLTGALCPNQDGVCGGARAECRGSAGWVCDDGTYANHSSAYETTEATCDAYDNDCDGVANHIECGTQAACTYGFCRTSLCITQYREGGTACSPTSGATPSDTDQYTCDGFRWCRPTYSICLCTGTPMANGRGTNCQWLPNPAYGGTARNVDTCGCGSTTDHLSYSYSTSGGTSAAADSRCDQCVGDGYRFGCMRP